MATITLNAHQVLDLLHGKVRSEGTSRSGTYNRADPTHFEHCEAWAVLEGAMEDARKFLVTYHDVTWGIEIKVEWVAWDALEQRRPTKRRRIKIDGYEERAIGHRSEPGPRSLTDWQLAFILELLIDAEWSRREPRREDREIEDFRMEI
jgi:hypothetical protein